MKKLLLIISFHLSINILSQTADSTLTIEFKNISDENALIFRNEIDVFINAINRQNLPKDLILEQLKIESIKNEGVITVAFKYNHERLFVEGSSYKEHYDYWSKLAGKGISLYLQNKINKAIEEYKLKIAYKYSSSYLSFLNKVQFEKSNGDWINVLSNNSFSNSRGVEREMLSFIVFSYNGQTYYAESGNYKTLSQANYFVTKSHNDLSGSKNEYFYLLKFFDME